MPPVYSDRIAGVAATCIQALARRRLGMSVPETTAQELAMVYGNVEETIRALERAREVHSGMGPSVFVDQLAMAEAAATSRVAREHTIAAVVEIRKEAHRNRKLSSRVVAEARKIDLRQDALRREMRDWSKGFASLLDSLDSLFVKTERRLRLLGLNPKDLEQAVAEAESILSRAIQRSLEDS
ncbi:MAG TPA: hypothetical protein VG225_05150 [Terracidiphilus sp.]|jgi:hypothetical protein|nr:hypothetical protein [Terracidiphilus sp.]